MKLRLPILFLFACNLHSAIHVIMTSAILPIQFEERKQEYLTAIHAINSYGFEPWIIEATPIHSSFFDAVSSRVLYPQTNDLSLRNKGVNEVMSIRACIPYLPFDDNDIVIKLTGRYHLYEPTLIHIIEHNPNFDAFVSYGKHFVSPDHIFTGCFAMKWKWLKQLINGMDLKSAERNYIPVEKIFADFLTEHSLKIKQMPTLDVSARIFYSGEGKEILNF